MPTSGDLTRQEFDHHVHVHRQADVFRTGRALHRRTQGFRIERNPLGRLPTDDSSTKAAIQVQQVLTPPNRDDIAGRSTKEGLVTLTPFT